MKEAILTFFSGAGGAALVAGVFALVEHRMRKKDRKEEKEDVLMKCARYMMLYIIQDQGTHYVQRGEISMNELRMMHKWHDLYHNGLGGNGNADALMERLDELPLRVKP